MSLPRVDRNPAPAAARNSALGLDPPGTQSIGPPQQREPRGRLDRDRVEQSIGGIGADRGAGAERAGAGDGDLPGATAEDLFAVAAHPAAQRRRREAGAHGPEAVGERPDRGLEATGLARGDRSKPHAGDVDERQAVHAPEVEAPRPLALDGEPAGLAQVVGGARRRARSRSPSRRRPRRAESTRAPPRRPRARSSRRHPRRRAARRRAGNRLVLVDRVTLDVGPERAKLGLDVGSVPVAGARVGEQRDSEAPSVGRRHGWIIAVRPRR